MFASLIRQRWPDTAISECHPKAIAKAIAKAAISIAGDVGCRDIAELPSLYVSDNEHERDARIASICVREGVEERWNCDLSLQRSIHEQDPKGYWLCPVVYYWPQRL